MKKLFLLIALAASAGCSLKTQTVRLDPPGTDRVVGSLKPAVIEAITDARDFTAIPEASGSRLDPDIAQALGPEGRSKAVSSMPRGPLVTLNEAGPVTETIRTELIATLNSHGYEVVAVADAPADAPRVRVEVKEFWAYMPFNFGRALTWTTQLKAWVITDVTVETPALQRQFTIEGHGAHIVQSYKRENIKQALDLALADYRSKLVGKLFGSL